jgi:hypothetical protein
MGDIANNNIKEANDLDIATPLSLPLTSQQLRQLRDPWKRFSLEEQFYILYDALTGMTLEFMKALRIIEIGSMATVLGPMFGIDDIETMKDHGLRAMCLAYWMGKNVPGIGMISKVQLIQPEETLSADKLSWGRAVRDIITDNDILIQIWGFRVDELVTMVQSYSDVCAEATTYFLDTPDMLELHTEFAKVQAGLANHRLTVLGAVKTKWIPLWNEEQMIANGLTFVDDVASELNRYSDTHENEFRTLIALRDEIGGRVKQYLESDPEHQKRRVEWQKRPRKTLMETLREMAILGGIGENCNNPNCEVHGEEVRRRKAAQENQPVPGSPADGEQPKT